MSKPREKLKLNCSKDVIWIYIRLIECIMFFRKAEVYLHVAIKETKLNRLYVMRLVSSRMMMNACCISNVILLSNIESQWFSFLTQISCIGWKNMLSSARYVYSSCECCRFTIRRIRKKPFSEGCYGE